MNLKISEKVVTYRMQNTNCNVKEPIGAYIKKERLAQGLNQDYVCKDICSISYYSRIENSLIVPSNEYIERIFQKFNKPIPNQLIKKNNYNDIVEKFLNSIDYRNDEIIDKEFENIKSIKDASFKVELYDLVYILFKEDLEKGKNLITVLHSQQNYFDNNELLLYLELLATYYLLVHKYDKSEEYLSLAIKFQDSLSIEKAIIYYKYAWVLGKLNNDIKSIDFAQKAENIFKSQNNLYRTIQCQILIAIKMSKKFPEKAIEIYENILKVANYSNYKHLYKISAFNLSLLYKKHKFLNKCENILRLLLNNYKSDLFLIFNVYIEYIDLLIISGKNNKAKIIYTEFSKLEYDNDLYNFFIKYYQYKLYETNLDKKITIYKNEFIPFIEKENNQILEIICRNEYAKLLEEKKIYIESITEYKKIIDLYENEKL